MLVKPRRLQSRAQEPVAIPKEATFFDTKKQQRVIASGGPHGALIAAKPNGQGGAIVFSQDTCLLNQMYAQAMGIGGCITEMVLDDRWASQYLSAGFEPQNWSICCRVEECYRNAKNK